MVEAAREAAAEVAAIDAASEAEVGGGGGSKKAGTSSQAMPSAPLEMATPSSSIVRQRSMRAEGAAGAV